MRSIGGTALLVLALAGCSAPETIETDEQTRAIGDPGAGVVINEFSPGSSGWIEIYNAGSSAADLSGWIVDDIAGGGYAPKSVGSSVTLAAHGYLVVTYAGINTASSDSVRLVNAAGVEIDSHSNFYAGSSTSGLCFGRQPDGAAWAAASIPCTRGASNGGLTCTPGTACDDGDACTSGETWSSTCVCGGGAPVSCDDANPCTSDTCASATGCSHAAAADGTVCGSGFVCQAGVCSQQQGGCPPPVGAAPATIVRTGTAGRLLLQGTIVTPDVVFDGEVLVEGDTLTCVATSCQAQQGALDATIVQTGGLIFPGLIDAHNHILFDIFDETDWAPAQSYTNHNQWPNDPRYQAMLDAKQWLNGETSGSPVSLGCEMDKYGELKGLVAGTTSIVGAATPSNKACYGSLARTIDQIPNDLDADHIQTAISLPGTATGDSVCANFASGTTNAYAIHVAEGVDATALGEFARLGTLTTTDYCLYSPKTTVVHGTALGNAELGTMAANGMSLVWSPRSNVFLYGGGIDLTKTANVPLALSKGINVAISPDWSIGGSQNLLDELRFADRVDNTVWGDVISPRTLVQMVTTNAARALGVGNVLGSLEPGKKADLMVIGGDPAAPYDSLLRATPRDVRLVLVGGVPLYGDSQLKAVGPASPGCEDLDVCCGPKFVCVAEAGGTSVNKLGQTYAEIVSSLESALQSYDGLDLTQWNFAPITPLVRCP